MIVEHPQAQHQSHLLSWAQVIIIAVVYLLSIGAIYGSMESGQKQLSDSVNGLRGAVGDLSNSVYKWADITARLDEHTRTSEVEIKRRLDILEKDSAVKEWRKQ